MNEQDIMNKLKSDPRALKSVMQSQDGQTLLRMLSATAPRWAGRRSRPLQGICPRCPPCSHRCCPVHRERSWCSGWKTGFSNNTTTREAAVWMTSTKN